MSEVKQKPQIKAQDLRIGNINEYYVCEDGIEWTTNIIDIEDLKWCDLYESDFNKVHRPIPLSEEWLIRMGFKSVGKLHPTFRIRNYYLEEDILRDGKYSLRQIINKQDSLCISPEIRYVHQLQNLYYALTGTELTIKDL